MLLFDLAAGSVIGGLVGLLGGGGSVLAVPLLVYGAHLSLRVATVTTLAIVLLSSAAALRPRLRIVRWRVALVMCAMSVPFTYLGSQLAHGLSDTTLGLCFAALMLVAAGLMVHRTGRADGGRQTPPTARRLRLRTLLVGMSIGTLTGMLGVGGGFLLVPAMTVLLGMDAATAIATELAVVVVNAGASLVDHLSDAVHPDWLQTAALAVAAVAASTATSRIAVHIPDNMLRRTFAAVVVAVAGYMSATALFPSISAANSAPSVYVPHRLAHTRRSR